MTDAFNRQGTGWIEVVVGSMFSGKTEELIRRLRRAQIGRQRVQVFKPGMDNRYSEGHVVSHDDQKIESIVVKSSDEILVMLLDSTRVVGIDEGQFFDDGLIDISQKLAERGIRVVIAGLDTDWKGRPFGPIPSLMAVAEYVTKQHAICVVCGAPASRTQRMVASDSDILVGASEAYEARCRTCFDPNLRMRGTLGLTLAAQRIRNNQPRPELSPEV